MRRLNVERIQQSAQGISGILDVLIEELLNQSDDQHIPMSANTHYKLVQSANVLAHMLNADTEDLQDIVPTPNS